MSKHKSFIGLLYKGRIDSIDRILMLAVGFGFVWALLWLVQSFNLPLLDQFGFRQTQTAISAYWMSEGGPLLGYDTPVLGAPWSIPFEFPLYQLLVVSVSALGIPLDGAGRLVSFAFFIGTLWPLWIVFERMKVGRTAFLATAALYLLSPFYTFWGRSFMIESTALFLGVGWLAFMLRFTQNWRWSDLGVAAAFGLLGIGVKSTTFATFGILGGAAVAAAFAVDLRWETIKWGRLHAAHPRLGRLVAAGLLCLIILLAGLNWVQFTDAQKMQNVLGQRITSDALQRFNYGALELRWSERLWEKALLNRALPELFGALHILAFVAIGAGFAARRTGFLALGCAGAALVPILLFTNLHVVHNYYQYANGLLLVAAVGIGISGLVAAARNVTAIILLSALVVSQLHGFRTTYQPLIESGLEHRSRYTTGLALREVTTPQETVLVFGDDWSSETLYYARRRGLAVPGWIPREALDQLIADPAVFMGGAPLGAIVMCNGNTSKGSGAERFAATLDGRALVRDLGGCQIYEGGTRRPTNLSSRRAPGHDVRTP